MTARNVANATGYDYWNTEAGRQWVVERFSIDAMVEGAKTRGYEYVAITEHSKAIAMAFGFDAARVRKSVGEIEAARERHPDIKILHGLEVDILPHP